MAMEKITENGVAIALVTGTCALTDEQTALDLIMEARYTLGAERIAIEKAAVSPDFFILSTGLAGAVLQKFINYGAKLAVYGDYSGYTSKPLRDFIRESNRGRDVFFPATRQEVKLFALGIAIVFRVVGFYLSSGSIHNLVYALLGNDRRRSFTDRAALKNHLLVGAYIKDRANIRAQIFRCLFRSV